MSNVRAHRQVGMAAVLVVGSLVAPSGDVRAAAPEYHVEFIGEVIHVDAMNMYGESVGWTVTSTVRAWIGTPEQGMSLLPLPPGAVSSRAHDINDFGVVVGVAGESSEFGRPVAWRPDGFGGYEIEDLGTLPGHSHGRPMAINSRGDVVGMSIQPGWMGGPAVWFNAPEGIRDLTPTGFAAPPEDINDRRFIVGGPYRMNLDEGVVEEFGDPPGLSLGRLTEINELNEMGGVAGNGSHHNSIQLVRYTDGFGWDIVTTGGRYDGVYGLNSAGMLSCEAYNVPSVDSPEFGLRELSSLLAPEDRDWALVMDFGNDINESGQILVIGSNYGTGESGAVLLTPKGLRLLAPPLVRGEPSTLAAVGAEAGDPVYFVYSLIGQGAGPCPSFFGGLCLDIVEPLRLADVAIADDQGRAQFTARIPNGAPLTLVHLQAVARRGPNGADSIKSEVVSTQILP